VIKGDAGVDAVAGYVAEDAADNHKEAGGNVKMD
jgi:hypothetical protein